MKANDMMSVDLSNENAIVLANNLKEVKDPIYLNGKNSPTEEGLFSYEIFGNPSDPERRFNWGYIDLGKKFLRPIVYDAMRRAFRKAEQMIAGDVFFTITKGGVFTIVKDDVKGAMTGLQGLQHALPLINFEKSGLNLDNGSVKFLSELKPTEFFQSKLLVLPAIYREIDLEGDIIGADEYSELYKKILSASLSLKNNKAANTTFMSTFRTDLQITLTMHELFTMLTSANAKKKGYIKEALLGKTIDHDSALVLVASKIDAARPDKSMIKFGEIGVPLHALLHQFMPFAIAELNNMFRQINGERAYVQILDNKIEIGLNTASDFNNAAFTKLIKFFARSIEGRLSPVVVLDKNGKKVKLQTKQLAELGRKDGIFTLTDMFYMAMHQVLRTGKHVTATRYPCEHAYSVVIAKPVIMTTQKTIKNNFFNYLPLGDIANEGEDAPALSINYYPDLDLDNPEKNIWIDGLVPEFSVLDGLGGDYDGDMMVVRGIWTNEGNMDAERIIKSPMYVADPNGKFTRSVSKEHTISLYMLTRD